MGMTVRLRPVFKQDGTKVAWVWSRETKGGPKMRQEFWLLDPQFPNITHNTTNETLNSDSYVSRTVLAGAGPQLAAMYQNVPQPNAAPQAFQPLGAIAAQQFLNAHNPYIQQSKWPHY